MSAVTKREEVYSAIEEASGLLDVTCSRENVWPVLTAFEDALADAVVVLSMASGEGQSAELDYTITVPAGGVDPYSRALSNGFIDKTEHPVGTLLSDIEERCPVRGYAIDVGVTGGFKKTYAFFALDNLPSLATLTGVPSVPGAVAENAGAFAHHGLADHVTMVGIDYQHRTMNVYFGKLPDGCLEPKVILAMLEELGLPAPSERTLEFIQKSFSIYITVGWDSAKVDRICFAVLTQDANALPARIEPQIAQFAKSAPHAYADERVLVYGSTLSPTGEYYKLGSYYQMPPETFKLLQTHDAFEDQAARTTGDR
ncbi:aromatic prenyltransferase [Phytohabitans houttuyneae]|uniref:Prenyltransferase n=1 Tax=Phytohabitans houttuyneae TaxID=1076126 RepID=A0A6V8K2I7_9ACTN|nr:aromatic prenyltransferase [Phytohabitans houttuyneae]GFJ76389.1 hypothetical protein Phou_005690 [Phytohabitans houttuyneae]